MSVWVGRGGGGGEVRAPPAPATTTALMSTNTSMESGIEAGVLPTVTGSLASAGDSLGSLSRAAEPLYDTDHTDLGSELDEAEIRRELMHDKWRLLFDRFDPEGFGEIPWPDFLQTLQHPDFIAQVPPHKLEILLDKARSATSDAITFQEFVNVHFNTLEIPKDIGAEGILRKFQEYCSSIKNETLQRHLFFTRENEDAETLNEFVTPLETFNTDYNCDKLRDSLIKSRFISGIEDSHLLKEANLDSVQKKPRKFPNPRCIEQKNVLEKSFEAQQL